LLDEAVVFAGAYELVPTHPKLFNERKNAVVPQQFSVRSLPVKMNPCPSCKAEKGADPEQEDETGD
jgi:hypothetical protein